MSCNSNIINGIALDCGSVGGLEKVWVGLIEDVVDIAVTNDLTNGDYIYAIEMVSGKTFKEISFRKGNGNFVSEGSVDDKAGTFFVTTNLTINLNKLSQTISNELKKYVNQKLYVIVKDRNSKVWLLGYDSYAYGKTNASSGAERGDANGYTITFTSETNEYPIFIEDGVIETII